MSRNPESESYTHEQAQSQFINFVRGSIRFVGATAIVASSTFLAPSVVSAGGGCGPDAEGRIPSCPGSVEIANGGVDTDTTMPITIAVAAGLAAAITTTYLLRRQEPS